MDPKKLAGLIVATAAVAFATAPITSTLVHAKSTSVKCYGGNSCKGKSSCKSAQNACKGKNSCKGKGWKKMSSEKKCTEMGGSTTEPTTNTTGS